MSLGNKLGPVREFKSSIGGLKSLLSNPPGSKSLRASTATQSVKCEEFMGKN